MRQVKAFGAALLGLGLIGFAATPAAAQLSMPSLSGLSSGRAYVSASGQWVAPEDADLSGTGVPAGAELDLDSDFGFVAAIGWHSAMGLRGEIEFAWHETDAGNLSAPGMLAAVGGDIGVVSGMANLVYEFPAYRWFNPYLGGGIGVAHFDSDLTGAMSTNESETKLAYQGIAGLAFEVTPNLSLTSDYRYFSMIDDPRFGGVEAEYSAHKVTAGLRFTFN